MKLKIFTFLKIKKLQFVIFGKINFYFYESKRTLFFTIKKEYLIDKSLPPLKNCVHLKTI